MFLWPGRLLKQKASCALEAAFTLTIAISFLYGETVDRAADKAKPRWCSRSWQIRSTGLLSQRDAVYPVQWWANFTGTGSMLMPCHKGIITIPPESQGCSSLSPLPPPCQVNPAEMPDAEISGFVFALTHTDLLGILKCCQSATVPAAGAPQWTRTSLCEI